MSSGTHLESNITFLGTGSGLCRIVCTSFRPRFCTSSFCNYKLLVGLPYIGKLFKNTNANHYTCLRVVVKSFCFFQRFTPKNRNCCLSTNARGKPLILHMYPPFWLKLGENQYFDKLLPYFNKNICPLFSECFLFVVFVRLCLTPFNNTIQNIGHTQIY